MYRLQLTWFDETREQDVDREMPYNFFKRNLIHLFQIPYEYLEFVDVLLDQKETTKEGVEETKMVSLNRLVQGIAMKTSGQNTWSIKMGDCFDVLHIVPSPSFLYMHVISETKSTLEHAVQLRREFQDALFWSFRQNTHRDEFFARYPTLTRDERRWRVKFEEPYGPMTWYPEHLEMEFVREKKRGRGSNNEEEVGRNKRRIQAPEDDVVEEIVIDVPTPRPPPTQSSSSYSHSYTEAPLRTNIRNESQVPRQPQPSAPSRPRIAPQQQFNHQWWETYDRHRPRGFRTSKKNTNTRNPIPSATPLLGRMSNPVSVIKSALLEWRQTSLHANSYGSLLLKRLSILYHPDTCQFRYQAFDSFMKDLRKRFAASLTADVALQRLFQTLTQVQQQYPALNNEQCTAIFQVMSSSDVREGRRR